MVIPSAICAVLAVAPWGIQEGEPGPGATAQEEQRAADAVESARRLFASGEPDDARRRLRTLATEAEAAGDPIAAADIWHALAKCELEASDVERALASCEQALRLHREVRPEGSSGVASSLSEVAFCLHSLGRSDAALARLEEGLAIMRRLFPGDQPDVASHLEVIAWVLASLGRHAEALPRIQDALALRRRLSPGDDPAVAQALRGVGSCLSSMGRSEEALPYQDDAAAMYERMFGKSHPAVAMSLNDVGLSLHRVGRSSDALRKYHEALAIYRGLEPSDRPETPITLDNIATCLSALGQPDAALPLLEEAAAMRRRLYAGDHLDVVVGLNSLGFCLLSLGRSHDALPRFEEATSMCRRLFAGDHPDLALCWNNVATCLLNLGRAADALPRFERALAMRERIHRTDHPDVATSLHNLAGSLRSLGRIGEALERDEAALEMLQRIFPGDHPQVAAALNSVGLLLHAHGRTEDAIATHDVALAMQRRLFPGDHPEVASSLGNIGACLADLDRATEAMPKLEEALAMRRRLFAGDHPELVASLDNVATCLVNSNRPEDALPLFEEAAGMARRLFPAGHPASVKGLVAMARERMKDEATLELAGNLLSEAIGIVESTRVLSRTLEPERRAEYFALLRRTDPYSLAIRLAIRRGNAELALEIAERARSRFLLDLLEVASLDGLEEAERRCRSLGDAEQVAVIVALREDSRRIGDEAARLTREAARIAADVTLSAAQRDERRSSLDGETASLAADRDRSDRERARVIADVVPALHPIAAEALRETLEPDELLLYFAIDDEQSHLFVADRDGVEVVPIPAQRSQIAEVVDARRASVGASPSARGKPAVSAETGGPGALFPMLIPSETWLRIRSAGRVIVVPDDTLHRFPLELLSHAPGRTWLDDGPPIAYAPSGSVHAWLRQRSALQREIAPELDVVAVGDCVFEPDDPRLVASDPESAPAADLDQLDGAARAAERFGARTPLPFTRGEALAACVAFDVAGMPSRSRVLFGVDASEANVFALAPRARFLHFATHGIFDEVSGQSLSALALSVPRLATADDDGFLKLDDLLHHWRGRLESCRMVVLSACDTQLGVEQRNEAPFALSFGFVYAGASSVVSSLWKVDDASTAELMSDFYSRLAKEGPDADRLAAFTEARKALRAKGRSPYHWAPFVYVGSPR